MAVIPLFTSAYSFRSILTLDKIEKNPEKAIPGTSDSIIEICQIENIDHLFLVEDNMVGFLEARKNLPKGIKLTFGLRITVCSDMNQKNDDSVKTESKYIIFAKNSDGYFRLIKIFSKAGVEGFYNKARIDFKELKKFWSDEDLLLAVPFYDSFIYMNSSSMGNCVPDFSFTKPVFFIEDNGLYFDESIAASLDKFDPEKEYERVKVQTIYYRDKKDFLAWQTYKAMKNESTLRAPNLNDCMSDQFCVESWKEKNERELT